MPFQLLIKPSAQKELEKLPKSDYYRVVSALSTLCNNPFIGKKLFGQYQDYYSFRIWPHRIIYRIIKKQKHILLIKIGHRQGVYK